jgi:hypothetical protein
MTLEVNPNYPSDLDSTAPAAGDLKAEGDDHLRNIKRVLKTTLPNVSGAITPTHTELNYVDGVTSAIQTQIDAKAAIASPTFTGTPAAPTAAAGTSTTQLATTAFVAGTAFSSALPAQTGNSGKFVTTDGTTASWADTLPSQTSNSGKFLTTNGTAASWGAVPAAALTLLATLTPTAAANVDALSTFTSSYDNYLILLDGIKPGTDGVLSFRFAVAGAADTGSNYYYQNGSGGVATTSANTSVSTAYTTTAAGQGVSLVIEVLNVNTAATGKVANVAGMLQSAATPGYTAVDLSAYFKTASVVSGIRFFWTAGNNFAAAGSIRIYGYSNT